MGPSSADGYDGFITFSGHLALTPGTSFYSYGKQMRRVMEIFADWMNLEHGGVDVGGKKYAVRFVWVDDRSSKTQVMNATAVALRSSNADFVWAGYSSGLTAYTAKQANADGFLMMSGGAASTSVFTQNDMSFGLFPPAIVYTESALEGIAKAAAGIDAGTSTWPYAKRCGTGSGDCKSSIKVGFIQAAASFTRSQCNGGPGNARANGLTVATNEDGSDLVLEIPKSPTLAETVAALEQLKDAGVNVITTCTYYSTGTKLAEGLHNMTWAPYALTVSATIGTQNYADAVRGAGGFIYEYVLGYSIWHGSQPNRGDYTGLTSAEFVDRFSARFDGAKPSCEAHLTFTLALTLTTPSTNPHTLFVRPRRRSVRRGHRPLQGNRTRGDHLGRRRRRAASHPQARGVLHRHLLRHQRPARRHDARAPVRIQLLEGRRGRGEHCVPRCLKDD